MIKLLIIDDEPLVQIGIKSMLNFSNLGIEICGTAFNGSQALAIIEEKQPEIVISDIKMPIMTGLELLKECRNRYEKLPIFIFLTSYDEFPLIKEAMKYQALDFLIKLDITPELLEETLQKAIAIVIEYQQQHKPTSLNNMQSFYDKFMIRLLNNLFEDESQFQLQANALKLEFRAHRYAVALCKIQSLNISNNAEITDEKLMNLNLSAFQMVNNLMTKHISCFVTALDPYRFCIIFNLDDSLDSDIDIDENKIHSALKSSFDMVHNYFNIHIFSSIGRYCVSPFLINESYQEARQIQALCSNEQPIIFFNDFVDKATSLSHNTFNLGILKNDIRLAFEGYDADLLQSTLNTLIDLFKHHPSMYIQAIDAACNILYLTLSTLPESKDALNIAFSGMTDSYNSIYKKTQIDHVVQWMEIFSECICELLHTYHKPYRNQMITDIQNYIDHHITHKLVLNEIASLFSISPNYLSILFKKTNNIGFNDYVTSKKIALAKSKILEGNMKVYEIAEELGYESAFYFSKVFKKVEGCSPRAFVNKNKIDYTTKDS